MNTNVCHLPYVLRGCLPYSNANAHMVLTHMKHLDIIDNAFNTIHQLPNYFSKDKKP